MTMRSWMKTMFVPPSLPQNGFEIPPRPCASRSPGWASARRGRRNKRRKPPAKLGVTSGFCPIQDSASNLTFVEESPCV